MSENGCNDTALGRGGDEADDLARDRDLSSVVLNPREHLMERCEVTHPKVCRRQRKAQSETRAR